MLREPRSRRSSTRSTSRRTVQLLTVSSSLKNPLTTGGRVLNILFEIWGVLFVAGVTGAFATFFLSDDREA